MEPGKSRNLTDLNQVNPGSTSIVKTLHLIPDTNLFIQCHDLGEIDWSELGEFDEILLIVCRPVQREIDHQKQRGNDRIGRRARKTQSMFREIIVGGGTCKLIREADPLVRLLIDPSCLPNPALGDRLDYGETDDRIVGCADTYRKQHPDSDVRLLTHDSGPMASARMVSVSFVPIPDSWLRPPEDNETERENKLLRTKLAHIENAEPRFTVAHAGAHGDNTDTLEFEWSVYEKLSDDIISNIVKSLRDQFPPVTDYGSREPVERKVQLALGSVLSIRETYTPPSEREIAGYTKTEYPAWIERCESILRKLHVSLEKRGDPIFFAFSSRNEGSRPGKDTLVTIAAQGNFRIRPPQIEDDEKEDETQDGSDHDLSFPSPPKPPKGKLTKNPGFPALDELNKIYGKIVPMIEPVQHLPFSHTLLKSVNQRRDPNAFYYKPDRSMEPSEAFSLECEQWRHGLDAEWFGGELCFDRNAEEIHGALECRIHAENLTIPAKKLIRVRGKPKPFDVRSFARKMMEDLFHRVKG